jgi:putative membrane protein insertion efficiency factor
MILKYIIRLYQYLISPLFGHRCRFLPSCSHYAMDCLNSQKPTKAFFLIVKRILKCHPWSRKGWQIDPAPNHTQ